jgi:hypothetical protein
MTTRYANRDIVTAENINDIKDHMSCCDQRSELIVGCETWGILGGQMTIWPSGRGAYCKGGDSCYGEWSETLQVLTLDDSDSDGNDVIVDAMGNETVAVDGEV